MILGRSMNSYISTIEQQQYWATTLRSINLASSKPMWTGSMEHLDIGNRAARNAPQQNMALLAAVGLHT
jgi:hypothetical protein